MSDTTAGSFIKKWIATGTADGFTMQINAPAGNLYRLDSGSLDLPLIMNVGGSSSAAIGSGAQRDLESVYTQFTNSWKWYAGALEISSSATSQLDPTLVALLYDALRKTSQIYKDALATCEQIVADLDLDDPDQRADITTRLSDVLSPFRSVADTLISGLLDRFEQNSAAVYFFLVDVLVHLLDMKLEAKLSIISDAVSSSSASTRFAAVQALDSLEHSQGD